MARPVSRLCARRAPHAMAPVLETAAAPVLFSHDGTVRWCMCDSAGTSGAHCMCAGCVSGPSGFHVCLYIKRQHLHTRGAETDNRGTAQYGGMTSGAKPSTGALKQRRRLQQQRAQPGQAAEATGQAQQGGAERGAAKGFTSSYSCWCWSGHMLNPVRGRAAPGDRCRRHQPRQNSTVEALQRLEGVTGTFVAQDGDGSSLCLRERWARGRPG